MRRALLLALGVLAAEVAVADPPRAVVQAEETIYEYTNADNGASPLWTFASDTLVRHGDDVYFCATELIPGVETLNRVRWALMQRTPEGWGVIQCDEDHRTRENSPIGITRDGRILMSVNPTLAPDDRYGPSEPRVLVFPPGDPAGQWETFVPSWPSEPPFSHHSYRGFGIDAATGECLITHQEAHHAQHWAFLSREREWLTGSLVFPDPPEYQREELRYLYPCVALKDRAAYVFARSGATEPIDEWYEYKKQFGGKNVSRRRLALAWTPDITTEPLSEWTELVNVMETGGEVWNADLYIAPDGDVHILWFEISVQPELRAPFFPDTPIRRYLKHGIVRDGALASVQTLVEGGEGFDGRPHWGRFHIGEDGTMYLLYTWWVGPSDEDAGNHTMLAEILPDGSLSEATEIPLAIPLSSRFMVASPRGGTPPSGVIDVVDTTWADVAPVRYVSIAVSETAPQVRIEGQMTLMPGEGRTVELQAIVDDPQDDVAAISWRLPGGEVREGASLTWEPTADATPVQAVATDAQGNTGVATVLVNVPPQMLAAASEPIVLEAEAFADQGGGTAGEVNIRGNHGRSLRGWRSVQWEFTAPADGEYAFFARYAAAPPGLRVSLEINGASPGEAFETIEAPGTGLAGEYHADWRWARLGPAAHLSAGERTLRLKRLVGRPHLDAICIVPVAQ